MGMGITLYKFPVVRFLLITIFLLFLPSSLLSGTSAKPQLSTSLSNPAPYAGEEIAVSYILHFSGTAPKIRHETPIIAHGAWVQEEKPDRYMASKADIKGNPGQRHATIRQLRLVPLQPGTLSISGYSLECLLADPALAATDTETGPTERLTAPEIILHVRALPKPVPEGYNGAVGNFALKLASDRTTLAAEKSLNCILTISGNGNLETLQAPALNLPDGFTAGTAVREMVTDPSSGRRILRITTRCWPGKPGKESIGVDDLVSFDPQTASYQRVHVAPLQVSIEKKGGSASTAGNIMPQDRAMQKQPETATSWLPRLVVVLLAAVGTIVGFLLWKRLSKQKNRQKSRDAVPQTAATNNARSLKAALMKQLAETGVVCPEALTRKELERSLRGIHVDLSLTREVISMLDALDRLLYSPASDGNNSVNDELVGQHTRLLNQLQQLVRKH